MVLVGCLAAGRAVLSWTLIGMTLDLGAAQILTARHGHLNLHTHAQTAAPNCASKVQKQRPSCPCQSSYQKYTHTMSMSDLLLPCLIDQIVSESALCYTAPNSSPAYVIVPAESSIPPGSILLNPHTGIHTLENTHRT